MSSVLAASAVVSIAPFEIGVSGGAFLLLMNTIVMRAELDFNMRA